ncbi:MAG: SDR family oxidoreductase [Phycisphaeraceae bacterium]|nr:SDR family oxidoreductase [Phycisphaeraceae bacterium]
MRAAQRERIALITGANRGIGLETARQLLPLGYTVILGARDAQRGRRAAEQLRGGGEDAVSSIPLDVECREQVEAAAREIDSRFGRLDVLINNAGVALREGDTGASTTSEGILRRTFDVNFFALVMVTQVMLPLLRRSEAGRIVNLSSVLGSLGEHADPNSMVYDYKPIAYDASKAAVNMFTIHLAHELRGTAIKVNAAHPGWVRTEMGGADAPMELEDGAKTSVWLATLPPDGPSGGFYHMQTHMRW